MLVLGIALVVLSAACAIVMLGAAVCARHSAQAAADLAALAAAERIGLDAGGASSSCAAAATIAAANGARIDTCDIQLDAEGRSGSAEVAVSRPVGEGALAKWTATARARAERQL